jgi:hypothetical protein
MLKKTSTSTYLVTALAVAFVAAGCSSDDTAAPSPVAGAGGQATSGGGAGRAGSGGSGGSTGGGGGATGGSSAGTSGAGGGDASIMDSGGAQAETAVILIDNMVVMRKPVSDAGGSEGGAASDAAGAVSDAAVPSDASVAPVSYTFDSDIQGWHYTPYGSSPNIGFADSGDAGRAKLSDASLSQLAFDSTNDADRRIDASGALKLTVGFVAANDQIDAQAFSVAPNDATQWKVWSGFIATAKIRLVSGGNLNRACALRATIYITTGAGYATAISPPINLTTAATDWATVTFDFDTIAPGPTAPNLTQVNQLGIQITTGTCP